MSAFALPSVSGSLSRPVLSRPALSVAGALRHAVARVVGGVVGARRTEVRSGRDEVGSRVVRRVVLAGALAVLLAGVVGVGIVLTGLYGAGRHPVAGGTVTVQAGQSLWDVAVSTGRADVSQTVLDIAELNGLTSSQVQPGQTLLVPAAH